MALIVSLPHTGSESCRPRVERADKPHQNHPLSLICLKVGRFGGGGDVGMVRVFKSGGMMFKHKNKFFHFQKHYLFIIFKTFIFLGGEIGRCPEVTAVSWITVASENLEHPTKCAWQAGSGGGPPLGAFLAAVPCPPPPPRTEGQDRKSKL